MIPAAQPIFLSGDLGKHIATLLTEIRVANGYETDVGQRVFRGKLKHDEDLVPYCVVVEGEDRPTDGAGDEIAVRQQYAVGAYLKCDPDNPNDAAHQAIRDIRRVIFARGTTPGARARLGNRVKRVRYLGKDIGPRADGRDIVFAIVHFEVEYVDNLIAAGPVTPPEPPEPEEPETSEEP